MRRFNCFIGVALLTAMVPAGAQTSSVPLTSAPATNAPSAAAATPAPPAEGSMPMVETLVCLRHGERTDKELGQLKIRGLNRALALPQLLLSRYGVPDYLFAPNPAEKIGKPPVCYVRALAALEPTAIYCDLPVNTAFGFHHVKELQAEITKQPYKNSMIFICWEHHYLEKFIKQVITDYGGNPAQAPSWKKDDYDSYFVLKLSHVNGKPSVTVTQEKENLTHLSDTFPGPTPPLPAGH
jgi:hypothetical protein